MERDGSASGTCFLTPKKSCQQTALNKSTTANLNSKDVGDNTSFEKLVLQQRQAMAVRFCSTNLIDLLGSDIKFKSPAHLMKMDFTTSAAEKEHSFFDTHDGFDTEAKIHKNGFSFEFSLRRESFAREESDYIEAPGFGHLLAGELNTSHHNTGRMLDYGDDFCTPKRRLPYLSRHESTRGYFPGRIEDMDSPRSQIGDDYRKRKRKNNLQLKILKAEFNKCDNWNKEKIFHVAQITGLSESQVYKWCWDQKKKVEEHENQNKDGGKVRTEISKLDFLEMMELENGESDLLDQAGLIKRRPDRQPFRPIN